MRYLLKLSCSTPRCYSQRFCGRRLTLSNKCAISAQCLAMSSITKMSAPGGLRKSNTSSTHRNQLYDPINAPQPKCKKQFINRLRRSSLQQIFGINKRNNHVQYIPSSPGAMDNFTQSLLSQLVGDVVFPTARMTERLTRL